jgi:hypothetical protein
MRSKYIVITALVITCGAGVASWRAASQISLRIQAATHLAATALSNAEEKAKATELALGISEAAERFAREELALERKTREAAELALDKAVNRTAQAALMLSEQGNMAKSFQENLADEITKEDLALTLAAQGATKKAIESKLDDLNTTLHVLDERIAQQVAARRRVRAELHNSKLLVLDLSSQLQQVRIKAEAKAQAPAGRRAAKIKAREITSDRRQAEKRAALNRAQKQTVRLPPLSKRPQVSLLQSLVP